MSILKEIHSNNWHSEFSHDIRLQSIEALEQGKILFFPNLPFNLSQNEMKYLSPKYAHPKAKNISYNPVTDKLRCADCSDHDYEKLIRLMERYTETTEGLVRELLSPYANYLELGRTSYRPVEVAGRRSSFRKDDSRLHVDAFPATPNHGHRILRVFTNINPYGEDRVWRIGEPFPHVASKFLPQIRRQFFGKAALLNAIGLTKSFRTEYDHIMLQIHDRMKANGEYQKTAEQTEVHFAPGTTWIVQTDQVSHAAMSGQYVLEQTFYLPIDAMANPELSPLRTLEKLVGRSLV